MMASSQDRVRRPAVATPLKGSSKSKKSDAGKSFTIKNSEEFGMCKRYLRWAIVFMGMSVSPSHGSVEVVHVAAGSVVLRGDVSGLQLVKRNLWTQTTYTNLYMDKSYWSRTQNRWAAGGFGAPAMRDFVNNALAVGIPLAKMNESSNDVTARVEICLNQTINSLDVYCFQGSATSTHPDPSPSCSVQDPRDVSFGTVEASDVSGRRANGSITVKCTKPTTVTIRFTSRSGQDLVTLAEGLNAKLRVSEKDGSVGTTYLNSGAVPNFSILSATLSSPNGAPKTGAFNYTAVVRVELH
ncbi:spore coat protein U domain-containing protein [Serratia inhibens]